jgi:hypothetical protein
MNLVFTHFFSKDVETARGRQGPINLHSTMGKNEKRVGGKRRRKGNEQGDLGSFIK